MTPPRRDINVAGMRRILLVLAFLIGGYFIVRAAVEPFVVDFADPSSYAEAWGGPSLFGVLAVHMGPGIIAAFLMVVWFIGNGRRKAVSAAEA